MHTSTVGQHAPRSRRLTFWIGVASIVSITGRLLLQRYLGPVWSLAVFLIIPSLLAYLIGKWWVVLVAPFVFWGYAWLFLWLSRLVITLEDLLPIILVFAVTSLVCSALGLVLEQRTR
jgi:hypothetical protein